MACETQFPLCLRGNHIKTTRGLFKGPCKCRFLGRRNLILLLEVISSVLAERKNVWLTKPERLGTQGLSHPHVGRSSPQSQRSPHFGRFRECSRNHSCRLRPRPSAAAPRPSAAARSTRELETPLSLPTHRASSYPRPLEGSMRCFHPTTSSP